MSIVVDIALILIFGASVTFFTIHGFDKAVHKIGKVWLAIALAFFIGPMVTGWMEDLFLRDWIVGAVYDSLVSIIENNPNGYNLAELFANLPENFVNFLDGLGASLTALEAEFGAYTEASNEILHAMAERMATPCINVTSSIIGNFLSFIVPLIFFAWLDWELKKDSMHVVFRVFDHVGGFLSGAALGYCVVLGIALLTRTTFQVVTAFDASLNLMEIYNNSFIFKFLNEFDAFGAIANLFQTIVNTLSSL